MKWMSCWVVVLALHVAGGATAQQGEAKLKAPDSTGEGAQDSPKNTAAPEPQAEPVSDAAPAEKPATESPPAERERLLVMDLKGGEEVKKTVTDTMGGLLAAEVARRESFETVSGEDIRNMVALEGQKQAMGCEDSSACLAEIAGALGARFVIFGRLNQVGGQFILQMSLLDATSTQVIGREVLKAKDERTLIEELPRAVADVLRPAFGALGVDEEKVALPEPTAQPEPEGSALPIAVLGSGVAVALAGVAVAVLAAGTATGLYWFVLSDPMQDPGLRKNSQVGWIGLSFLSAIGVVAIVPGLALVGTSFVLE